MQRLKITVCALLLAGCSTAYQSNGFSGGWRETQLGEDVFQVSFRGNGYTSGDRAADFAFLRCAEVALEHGYSYFTLVESKASTQTSTYTAPSTVSGTSTTSGGITYGNATVSGGQTTTWVKPSASNTVWAFKTKPAGFAYDARFVVRSLRQKYGMAPSPLAEPMS